MISLHSSPSMSLAKNRAGTHDRGNAFNKARLELTSGSWAATSRLRSRRENQFDFVNAREVHDQTLQQHGARTFHFCSVYGPHFPFRLSLPDLLSLGDGGGKRGCSMKISKDARQYTPVQAIAEEEALPKGMEESSKETVEAGAEFYIPALGEITCQPKFD